MLPNEITITWHVDDVREVRPNLTAGQAREVLQALKRNHDANTGISWDTIITTADCLFSRKEA